MFCNDWEISKSSERGIAAALTVTWSWGAKNGKARDANKAGIMVNEGDGDGDYDDEWIRGEE